MIEPSPLLGACAVEEIFDTRSCRRIPRNLESKKKEISKRLSGDLQTWKELSLAVPVLGAVENIV